MSEILNWKDALERMADDEELLLDVVELFVDDVPVQLELFSHALDAGDSIEACRIAHGLKGASASIGADRLSKELFALELLCKQSAEESEIKAQFEVLKSTLVSTLQAIEKQQTSPVSI